MSKPSPGPERRVSAAKLNAAYWRARVYRNSYTRAGTTRRVRHWTVKIQHDGVRRTVSLRSTSKAAAAAEAANLYQSIVRQGWKATHAGATSSAIPRSVRRDGIDAVARRFPREITVGIHWAANPVAWTYFTAHLAARPHSQPPPDAVVPARAGRLLPVAVVEPDPHRASALRDCLDAQPGMRCVATFAQAVQALSWVGTNRVALLLANQDLGDLSGAAFLDRVRHVAYAPPGLLYSVHDDSEDLFRSAPAGAVGYLFKRTPTDCPLEPLAGLPADSWPESAQVALRARTYFQQLSGSTPVPLPSFELARLTAREREILGLISQGFPDKEVSKTLQISGWTVHGHLKRIYGKLGVRSRTEAVVKYLQK